MILISFSIISPCSSVLLLFAWFYALLNYSAALCNVKSFHLNVMFYQSPSYLRKKVRKISGPILLSSILKCYPTSAQFKQSIKNLRHSETEMEMRKRNFEITYQPLSIQQLINYRMFLNKPVQILISFVSVLIRG